MTTLLITKPISTETLKNITHDDRINVKLWVELGDLLDHNLYGFTTLLEELIMDQNCNQSLTDISYTVIGHEVVGKDKAKGQQQLLMEINAKVIQK